MSQKDFNREMNSYFRSKSRSKLFENIKSKLSDIKSIQVDNVKTFSGNVSKRMTELKDRLPKEKIGNVLRRQPAPDQKEQPAIPLKTAVAPDSARTSRMQSVSDYLQKSDVFNKLKSINVTRVVSSIKKHAERLKPASKPAPSEDTTGFHQVEVAALQKEKGLEKSTQELESLKEKKEALEQEISKSQQEQIKEKEQIDQLAQQKEEDEIRKKIILEQQLKEKEKRLKETEKEKGAIEKEAEETLRKKQKLEQEINALAERKKAEEIRLEEIRKFRKQEGKELGMKRFIMSSPAKQEDNQQATLERQKQLEELKLQKELARKKKEEERIRRLEELRLEKELIQQKREEEQKRRYEELKLQKELAIKKREEERAKKLEEIKRQKELKRQKKLEKRRREGIKLGFIRIKTAEQVERERQEEEQKIRIEDEKKAQEMKKMQEELHQKNKSKFFTNVKDSSGSKDDSEYVVHQEETTKGSNYVIKSVKKGNDNIIPTAKLKK